MEVSFCVIKRIVSTETLLNSPYWTNPFTVHIYAFDKQLVSVIIKNDKLIDLFLIKLRNPWHNYTTPDEGLLLIVDCLNQFRGILFRYKINKYLDNNNLVYSET